MADNAAETGHSRAQIEVELLREWGRLESYAEWNPSSPTRPPGIVTPAERDVVELWLNLFAEEIDLVRRGRNTVVHGVAASDEQLQGAIDVANKLWSLLHDRLRMAREPKVTEWVFQLHRSGRPWDNQADEVDWAVSAVGEPTRFFAQQFGASAWYAPGPVVVRAAEDLETPAWTVSRAVGETPIITGLVGHPLTKGDEFTLPVTDSIIGNVPRI